jgi:hypothetical protein
LRHFGQITVVEDDAAAEAAPDLKNLKRHEFTGLLRGPWALLRGRMAGRVAAPLRRRSMLRRLVDFRNGRMWGEPGPAIVPGRLALTASLLGAVGTLGVIDALPSALRTVIVASFVLVGPGTLIMSFFTELPKYALRALIPTIGLAVCILAVTGLLVAGVYNPAGVLMGLALSTVAGGLTRCAFLTRRDRGAP